MKSCIRRISTRFFCWESEIAYLYFQNRFYVIPLFVCYFWIILWSLTNIFGERKKNRQGKKWNHTESFCFSFDITSKESKNQHSNITKINRNITNLINFSINCVNIRYLSQMGKCYRAAREWGGMAREHEANDRKLVHIRKGGRKTLNE